MPTLRHTVTLVAVPRRWLEGMIVNVHDLASEVRSQDGGLYLWDDPVPGIRHTGGRHLSRGATYELLEDEPQDADPGPGAQTGSSDVHVPAQEATTEPDVFSELEIKEWSRLGTTRVEVRGTSEEGEFSGGLTLDSAQRPTSFTGWGAFRGTGSLARYRTADLKGVLDLGTLWRQASGEAPLRVGVRHPLLQATADVRVKATKGDRWKVTVTANWRGRRWLRPLQAVASFAFRARIRAEFVAGIDEFAAGWNEEIPKVIARDPADLRSEALAAFAEEHLESAAASAPLATEVAETLSAPDTDGSQGPPRR